MMKRKVGLMALIFILMIQLVSGFAAVVDGEEAQSVQYNIPSAAALPDTTIIDDLLENLNDMMQTMRAYMEELREIVEDLIPGLGPAEPAEEPPAEEPTPVEEPPPAEPPPAEEPTQEEPVPSTGTVEGRLADNDRNPMSGVTVIIGPREMQTNQSGYFFFEEVPFGSYDLYLADDANEDVYLTTVHIDANNLHYSVNLIVSLPDADDDTEIVEVMEVPEEELEEDRGLLFILFVIILLLVLAIIALYFINRKHIRIVDARTGEEIEKQKIEFKPKTRIDLTEAFENASNDAVRVQFLKPATKKLSGFRIVFLHEDVVVGEINQYAGELEHIVKLPSEPPANDLIQKVDDPEESPPHQ